MMYHPSVVTFMAKLHDILRNEPRVLSNFDPEDPAIRAYWDGVHNGRWSVAEAVRELLAEFEETGNE